MDHQTTKQEVADLLENFAEYVNPNQEHDPWFTLAEVNRQFAWDDIPDGELTEWLNQLVAEGFAVTEEQDGERVWAWLF